MREGIKKPGENVRGESLCFWLLKDFIYSLMDLRVHWRTLF